MKEYLTEFFQKHKTYSFSEKLMNKYKLNDTKTFLIYLSSVSLLSSILLNIVHITLLKLDNMFLSISLNGVVDFALTFGAIFLILTPFAISSENQENNFKIKMRKILFSEQKEPKLKEVLQKINAIYFYQMSKVDMLENNKYKHAIEQLKEGSFSIQAFNIAEDITCDIEKLNKYMEKNKELIEMPYENLRLMTQKHIANILLEEEKNRQEKLDFIQAYADLIEKEEVIFKKNKTLSTSL